ncbi:MAG TPA: hypothetical protein VMM18_15815 [Gemmatimonadaceae bacterium]|nr:hypothetical protein [Gemmatimonadaceae bacterium]
MARVARRRIRLGRFGTDLEAQRGGGRATPIGTGESCPPGTTEIRPRTCMGPEVEAPSILDYRPRSTLVVPAHPVPKAKYPAIDFRGHPVGALGPVESLARLGAELDALNVRLMISAGNTSGEALRRTAATIAASPQKMNDRVRVLTGIDFRGVGPGWAERAVAMHERPRPVWRARSRARLDSCSRAGRSARGG